MNGSARVVSGENGDELGVAFVPCDLQSSESGTVLIRSSAIDCLREHVRISIKCTYDVGCVSRVAVARSDDARVDTGGVGYIVSLGTQAAL